MVEATLTVTVPEREWIEEISTAHPSATFRILATVPGAASSSVLVRILGPEVHAILEGIGGHRLVVDLTVVQVSDTEAIVHVRGETPIALFPDGRSESPIEFPIDVRDGEAMVEVTGSHEHLSAVADLLAASGFQYRVDGVRESPTERQVLSERQWEVVVTAVERGYYDTPRRCSLTQLAEVLDIAKSTCSETLHRAEEAIVKRFVDGVRERGDRR